MQIEATFTKKDQAEPKIRLKFPQSGLANLWIKSVF